jgi:hypothetical protein
MLKRHPSEYTFLLLQCSRALTHIAKRALARIVNANAWVANAQKDGVKKIMALALPAFKNNNQLTMVTWEDASGNGGASKGGEGRRRKCWRGLGREQQSPTTMMTKSLPLLHLQLKK